MGPAFWVKTFGWQRRLGAVCTVCVRAHTGQRGCHRTGVRPTGRERAFRNHIHTHLGTLLLHLPLLPPPFTIHIPSIAMLRNTVRSAARGTLPLTTPRLPATLCKRRARSAWVLGVLTGRMSTLTL